MKTKAMMEGVEGILSLAQGVVFWSPPERAIQAATAACSTPLAHSYGPAQGMPALRQALIKKLAEENEIHGVCPHSFVVCFNTLICHLRT